MRYSSSKAAVNKLNSAFAKIDISPRGKGGIPGHIPLTKSGIPDMRSKASKQWVAEQAANSTSLPSWLPKKKDGSLDTSKAATVHYLNNARPEQNSSSDFNHDCREN